MNSESCALRRFSSAQSAFQPRPIVLSNHENPLSFETITVGVATLGVTYTVPSGAVEIAPCSPPFVVANPTIRPPVSNVAPPSKLVKQKIPAILL